MRANDDVDLARRLSDEAQLEEILRTLGPAVRELLLRKYSGWLRPADVEDVLSIALFRLWKHRDAYSQERGSIRCWFFRIAENAARDVFKLGWHQARRLEVSWGQLADDTPAPSSEATRTENATPAESESAVLQVVREILQELPDAQRRILIADTFTRDGPACSKHLAQELGISESTVRVYRKRGLEAVKAKLRELGYEIS